MSGDQGSSQSKTEQPTQKKLRDLRKKGEISQSRDLIATGCVLIVTVLLSMSGYTLLGQIGDLLNSALIADLRVISLDDPHLLAQKAEQMMFNGLLIVAPMLIVLICASAFLSYVQVGGLFVVERIKPDIKRINPIEGVKRLFSLHNLVELIKLIMKFVFLAGIVYILIRQTLPVLFNARFMAVEGMILLAGKVIGSLAWMALIIFVPLAGFDLWFQRWDYIRKNRMTKEEVKREYKETEGDPHIKGKRNQLKHELSMQAMLDNVRKANVVVVNPTHVAVALYYNPGETDLPVVVGKGEGHIAEAIRKVAEQEGIPILQDIQLARQLQAQAPINQYIPEDLMEPVAVVLRWVRDLKQET